MIRKIILTSLVIAVFVFAGFVSSDAQVYILDGTKITASQLLQAPDAVSLAKSYRIGATLQIDDRIFKYAKVGANTGVGANTKYGLGFITAVQQSILTGSSDPGIVASALAATTVGIIKSSVTANDFQNGVFTYLDSAIVNNNLWSTQIRSNTASATGDTVYLTLVDGLPETLVTGDSVIICPNIYSNVVTPSATLLYAPLVGMCSYYNVTPTDYEGYYTWIQTWGPYTPVMASSVAGIAGQVSVYHKGDGKLAVVDSLGAVATGAGWIGAPADSCYTGAAQLIGWVMNRTTANTARVYPMVYLTISR